jgi:uncharacterized OsmC-like protein
MSIVASAAAEPVYISEVYVRPGQGPDKLVSIPAEPTPIVMGAHGVIAQRLGAADGHQPHATTLDYLVGAVAACLAGTFARAMRGRGVKLHDGCYECSARGEVRDCGGVLVLTRIEVRHTVRLDPELQGVAERVHGFYEKACAAARSVGGSIALDSILVFD